MQARELRSKHHVKKRHAFESCKWVLRPTIRQVMGQKGVPKPLVLVVGSGSSGDLNTTGQAVSALRRLASNADNAVELVRVSNFLVAQPFLVSVFQVMRLVYRFPWPYSTDRPLFRCFCALLGVLYCHRRRCVYGNHEQA